MITASAPVCDARAVGSLLGVAYTDDQVAGFGPPPGPLDGFVTFLDPGWSIVRLRACVAGRRVFYPQSWYDGEPFALAEDLPRYRRVRMSPLPDSACKSHAEQLALLPAGEEVPAARAVVAALAIHLLATAERLLPDAWVRCADRTADGCRVVVGSFDPAGLSVNVGRDGGRYANLGLASSRRC